MARGFTSLSWREPISYRSAQEHKPRKAPRWAMPVTIMLAVAAGLWAIIELRSSLNNQPMFSNRYQQAGFCIGFAFIAAIILPLLSAMSAYNVRIDEKSVELKRLNVSLIETLHFSWEEIKGMRLEMQTFHGESQFRAFVIELNAGPDFSVGISDKIQANQITELAGQVGKRCSTHL